MELNKSSINEELSENLLEGDLAALGLSDFLVVTASAEGMVRAESFFSDFELLDELLEDELFDEEDEW